MCPPQVKKDEESKADADKPKAEEAEAANAVEQTKADSSVKEEADTDMKDADAASQDGIPEGKSEGKDVKVADKQKEVSKEEPQEKIPERPVLQLHGKLSTSGLTPIISSQCVLWQTLLSSSCQTVDSYIYNAWLSTVFTHDLGLSCSAKLCNGGLASLTGFKSSCAC